MGPNTYRYDVEMFLTDMRPYCYIKRMGPFAIPVRMNSNLRVAVHAEEPDEIMLAGIKAFQQTPKGHHYVLGSRCFLSFRKLGKHTPQR